jgi:mannose-6-phosphate isomerase-like protein (cupin superfamily)
MSGVERISHNGELLAIILRAGFNQPGTHFFTHEHDSMQLSHQERPTGQWVGPHAHNKSLREVHETQEVLCLRSGRARFDFYAQDGSYLESRIVGAGDVILLARGGHGYEVLETVTLVEVKQGPYLGENDSIQLTAVQRDQARIVDDD